LIQINLNPVSYCYNIDVKSGKIDVFLIAHWLSFLLRQIIGESFALLRHSTFC